MRYTLAVAAALLCTSCAGSDGLPSAPTPAQTTSPLAGNWAGTVTVTPREQLPTTGPMTWTVTVVPLTNAQAFSVTMRSLNPWIPFTATGSMSIDPTPNPPGRIQGSGSYTSPRACVGTFFVQGPVTTTKIDADLSGSDCRDEDGLTTTFSGRVQLTKQ